MKIEKIKTDLEKNNGKPIPPEIIAAGATVLVEVINQIFTGRKMLRQRVADLETVCKLQAAQISEITKKLENL
jgi:hypothetical protein